MEILSHLSSLAERRITELTYADIQQQKLFSWVKIWLSGFKYAWLTSRLSDVSLPTIHYNVYTGNLNNANTGKIQPNCRVLLSSMEWLLGVVGRHDVNWVHAHLLIQCKLEFHTITEYIVDSVMNESVICIRLDVWVSIVGKCTMIGRMNWKTSGIHRGQK